MRTKKHLIDRELLSYRPCVGIALFNARGEVFVGERIDTPQAWQMPQGGINEGEDIIEAGLRELSEEIGTNKAKIIRVAPKKIRYDLPDELIKRHWNAKYRGQEQTWLAARFVGCDADINLSAHHPPEFSNWQWIALERTTELIVPFKHEIYKTVISFFEDIADQKI